MSFQSCRLAPQFAALFVLGAINLSIPPARATVYNVSNDSGMTSAPGSVNAGDSIVMAAGNYSGFTVARRHPLKGGCEF